jgi:hypothetical protein
MLVTPPVKYLVLDGHFGNNNVLFYNANLDLAQAATTLVLNQQPARRGRGPRRADCIVG